MASTDVHTVPSGDHWKVKHVGQDKPVATAGTQAEADQVGRDTAREEHVEYNLHGANGQVRVKDSYGNDPTSTKG